MQQLDCELNWLSMNARQRALEPWKSKISKVNIYVNKHIIYSLIEVESALINNVKDFNDYKNIDFYQAAGLCIEFAVFW